MEQYYIVRRGTNARIMNHDKTPMIVEKKYINDAIDYCLNVPAFRLQEGDLEEISIREFIEKFELGPARLYEELKDSYKEDESEEARL